MTGLRATAGALIIGGTALFAAGAVPAAGAAPPESPDLSALSPVDPQRYVATTKGTAVVGPMFSTPFGYECTMSDLGGRQSASCSGRQLPGYPADPAAFCGAKVGADGGAAVFSPGQGACATGAKPLESGHRIDYAGMTCGVGPDFTACTIADGGHGFVLRQGGDPLLF